MTSPEASSLQVASSQAFEVAGLHDIDTSIRIHIHVICVESLTTVRQYDIVPGLSGGGSGLNGLNGNDAGSVA